MKQQFTILFDLDGTLVDTAPDLMRAHNHVMRKFGYPTKSTDEIRNLVGQGAGAMLGRSIWGQAKKEFGKVQDENIKKEMVKEFVEYYGDNIVEESNIIDEDSNLDNIDEKDANTKNKDEQIVNIENETFFDLDNSLISIHFEALKNINSKT